MRLAVFGATGRTGIPLLKQSLERGHTLKVLVRNVDRLKLSEQELKNVTVVEGNATNQNDVDRTIEGTDAVLNVLGHASNSPSDILTKSTSAIIQAMKKHNVKLHVVLSMESVVEKGDNPSNYQKMCSFLVNKVGIKALATDSYNQGELIRAVPREEIDYVIVRGPQLTEGPFTGNYKVSNYFEYGLYMKSTISRADAAHFMLNCLESKEHLGRCPCIKY
ncbi:flavin reductase [Acrasis kona]|uniref:Flavin reductase n=1 Tax=Acrasis kona TaxID=1008807 RepID=A0AAW2ZNC8_9EUKA